jgi:hypothetical protein
MMKWLKRLMTRCDTPIAQECVVTFINADTGEKVTHVWNPPRDGKMYALRSDGTYELPGGQCQ